MRGKKLFRARSIIFMILLSIVSLSFLSACQKPFKENNEVFRVEKEVYEQLGELPGLASYMISYGEQGPTGSLRLDIFISVHTNSETEAKETLEEVCRIITKIVPANYPDEFASGKADAWVKVKLWLVDQSVKLDLSSLGMDGAPSVKDLLERYGK